MSRKNYSLAQHRKSDTAKWIVTAIVILMIGVAIACAMTQGFTNANPYGWLDKKVKIETGTMEFGDKVTALRLQVVDIDIAKILEEADEDQVDHGDSMCIFSARMKNSNGNGLVAYTGSEEDVYMITISWGEHECDNLYAFVTAEIELEGCTFLPGWNKMTFNEDEEMVVEQVANGTTIQLGGTYVIEECDNYAPFYQLIVPIA